MTRTYRGLFLATLSLSVLALAACGTTSRTSNMSNQADASRVDSILERAARDAKASGNKVETVTLLEKLYSRNEDDPAIATSYGQALREDEQLNRARQVLTPFTQGKKAYPDAVTELAMVQLALGQYKEAELTAKRSVELDPQSGKGYLALGTALDAQNYHEPAEAAFRKGLDNWKGDPATILNNLALNLASQNKLDQALDMLNKAKEVSPGRMEIERNYRIISTLKESADDFIIKQNALKEAPKKEAVKEAEKPKTEKAEDVAKKQSPVQEKPAEKKVEEKKVEEKKTEEKKPAAEKTVKKEAEKPASKKTAPVQQKSKKTQNFNKSE